MDATPVRRPWSRSRMWGVVGLLTALAAVALKIAVPYAANERLIRQVEKAGGSVLTVRVGPAWVRNLVGDKPLRGFERVTAVDLSGQRPGPSAAAIAGFFTELESLRPVADGTPAPAGVTGNDPAGSSLSSR